MKFQRASIGPEFFPVVPLTIGGHTLAIPLGRGRYALTDAGAIEPVGWRVLSNGNVAATGTGTTLASIVGGNARHYHANGNKLDCRKINLIPQPRRGGRGAYQNKPWGCWYSKIHHRGRKKFIGNYSSKRAAETAHRIAVEFLDHGKQPPDNPVGRKVRGYLKNFSP